MRFVNEPCTSFSFSNFLYRNIDINLSKKCTMVWRSRMPQPTSIEARYSHSGICTSDLEASVRFYKEVFGFADGNKLDIHNEFQPLMSLEGDVHLRSAFLKSDRPVIERLELTEPRPIKSEAHMLHNTGLGHLSFNVDVLDPIIADVRQITFKSLARDPGSITGRLNHPCLKARLNPLQLHGPVAGPAPSAGSPERTATR
jgi:catechol 2,3-dioxygenase-like lactoylglutathione lyase family enzyme